MEVVNFTFWPLYAQERTPAPTEQEAGWALEAIRTFWRSDEVFPLPGFKPQTGQPVA